MVNGIYIEEYSDENINRIKDRFIKPSYKKNDKSVDTEIIIEKYSDENINRMKDRFIELSNKHRDGELEFVKYISSNEKHRYNRLKYKYVVKRPTTNCRVCGTPYTSIMAQLTNCCRVCGTKYPCIGKMRKELECQKDIQEMCKRFNNDKNRKLQTKIEF